MGRHGDGAESENAEEESAGLAPLLKALEHSFGEVWPTGVSRVLDYLQAVRECSTPVSTQRAAIHALSLIECAGGVEAGDRLGKHTLVEASLKEAAASQDGRAGPTKKAPPTTLALVAAFKPAVVNSRMPKFLRMRCWYRCVRLWSAMRFDDHRGLIPSLIRMLPSCMRATLFRTNTTGTGKRKEQLEMIVDRQAYICEAAWLEEGWKLWDTLECERGLCLGVPSDDLSSVRRVEARYADAVAMAISCFTQRHALDAHTFCCCVLGRAALPSRLGTMPDVTCSWIDDVGRLAQPTPREYVRTALQRARILQQKVAAYARGPHGPSPGIYEAEVCADWAEDFIDQGVTTDGAVEQVATMTHCLDRVLKRRAPQQPTESKEYAALEDPELPGSLEVEARELSDAYLPLGMFVVSILLRAAFRRLHQAGPHASKSGLLLFRSAWFRISTRWRI